MRWAAELTLLFGGIMLWGHLSVTYARPVPHFSAQTHAAPKVERATTPPRNAPKNSPANDPNAERRADDLPSPPAGRRPNGHMTPEDRRLLREHIKDAVRELYSH
ncbi:hypothetical protein PPN31114_00152 [Pandoraea pneumonica]|jgi:hypothetical protein|uniref:Uncharacterized protein n=1 Tax=Pandoraea pneumonica TaxID=2508299 RepID=A0A5E4RHR9_9BURK|nr:hypothetical protein [Pandoraea pneumonica]VVD62094.1 hypothetical protein PPN31114_00152 [Pandoraea pneumonica]